MSAPSIEPAQGPQPQGALKPYSTSAEGVRIMTVDDLQDIDGEPRVRDLRIAERARLKRLETIREVIANNRDELLRYGSLSSRPINPGPQGGRPGTEYWLNEGQTLLLFTKLKGDVPADARQEIIAVYMEWRQGRTAAVQFALDTDQFSDSGRWSIAARAAPVYVSGAKLRCTIFRGVAERRAGPASQLGFSENLSLSVIRCVVGAVPVQLLLGPPWTR